MLTLDSITLYYWDIVMYLSKQHSVGVIDKWATQVRPGAPSSHRSAASSATTHTKKTQASSRASGTAPPSTIPSSTSSSVLTKSLAVSEPTEAVGLYRRPPKAHPASKPITQQPKPVFEPVAEVDDENLVEIGLDEDGAFPLELENQSTNPEFCRAQDSPEKATQVLKKKVCIYFRAMVLR